MKVIEAKDVDDALWQLVNLLKTEGLNKTSRAGNVFVYPTPITTIYFNPRRRVLLSPERDANPFFHLVEAFWMLDGRDDLPTVEFFNRRMRDFSDDGVKLHGAYGKRWRNWKIQQGVMDQLERVIKLLKNHPHSRRAVIQMWNPASDLLIKEDLLKDAPCNLTISVQINYLTPAHRPELDIIVFCRSNDAIWGATGANAVHFSILQEYLAKRLDISMGKMYQISVNLHAYESVINNLKLSSPDRGHATDVIITDAEYFDIELRRFFEYIDGDGEPKAWSPEVEWSNKFFPEVALPMVLAYRVFRRGGDEERYEEMLKILNTGDNSDWTKAAREWTQRRWAAFLEKRHGT